MKVPDQKWKDDFVAAIKKYILKGDYRTGLEIARAGLKKYPKEFICRYQYAKLLGDWADELSPKLCRKYKKQAANILLPLTKSLSGQNFETRFGVCINYYYQSFTFKNMYAYGKRISTTNKQKSFYAQGLGACLYAFVLYEKKQKNKAAAWAKKSVKAWQKYNLKSEKYYFAHYTYAKALAISGQPQLALSALKHAAKVSSRSVNDWEFKDVLQIINS